ncbi:MAG: hypothetical protein WBA10_07715 [Elainellaceae cyanobacterium]
MSEPICENQAIATIPGTFAAVTVLILLNPWKVQSHNNRKLWLLQN